PSRRAMALRTLSARMRSSALRVPPPAPRDLPALAARVRPRFFCSTSAQGGQQGKRLDLNKASQEEVLREVELIGKQIDEAWEGVRREKEKVPYLMKDMFGTVKRWFSAGIFFTAMLTAPKLRPAAEAQPEQ
uniref:Uncharacterized protein n=2 Tax=Aegilops tauschii subsp. strangulata TaxID=200361 RepID=A0A453QBQ9_AEGTS